MSEHDFDKQLRKKLDSLETDYRPEAWESFKKLMPVPWYISFLKTYGGWIFGGLSSLALLFTFFYNPKSKPFENTLTSTKNEVTETIVVQTDTVFKADTVYKYVYINQYVYKDREEATLNTTEQQAKPFNESKSDAVATMPSLKEDEPLGIQQTTDQQMLEADGTEVEEDEKAKLTKEIEKDSIYAPKYVRQEENKVNFWNKLSVRPGVEVDYIASGCFSFGVIAEVFLKKRFSITTGLSISNSSPVSFHQPKEFNKFTGKDFEDKYKPAPPPMPGVGGIKDIKIETARIRMPVYMTYYVPLTYSLDFLISAGTRFDLKVTENVSFRNDGFTENPFRSLERDYQPKVFNNLYYGMGLQYRYGRVYGQFTPYFEFPFARPSYLISPNKFGLNAALKFSLK